MIDVTCAQCGKTFRKQPSAVSTNNFCSRACFGAWRVGKFTGSNNGSWRGGHTEYRGENWTVQRMLARERDGHTCQRCGKHGRSLPVHHKRPFHLFSDYRDANALDNLVTLCHRCHGIEEVAFWKANPDLVKHWALPNTAFEKVCQDCGQAFNPRSPAALICDACRVRTCANCGVEFVAKRTVGREVKYCSRACRNAHIKRVDRVCEGCGATFTLDLHYPRFCSKQCFLVHANPRRSWAAKRSKT